MTKVDDVLQSAADIVIYFEFLEHVQPPIKLAFTVLFKLLMPGGWLILSVPHGGTDSPHEEHFPIMTNSELVNEPIPTLKGIDPEGNEREF